MDDLISLIELVHIGDVGFMFKVRQNLKHNLISPGVLVYFDGVQDSIEFTNDCAFPDSIPNTNLRRSIFQYKGRDWTVCSDGTFRKCAMVECEIRQNAKTHIVTFYVDRSLNNISGVISNR